MKQNYRPDIDGLRAIAVAGVLCCHHRIPHLAGGFAGVDCEEIHRRKLQSSVLMVGRYPIECTPSCATEVDRDTQIDKLKAWLLGLRYDDHSKVTEVAE